MSIKEWCLAAAFAVAVSYWVYLMAVHDTRLLHSGYVCKKTYEPGRFNGKMYLPDSWSVEISESDTCSGNWQTSIYTVSHENYDALKVGERVIADDHQSLFPAESEDK